MEIQEVEVIGSEYNFADALTSVKNNWKLMDVQEKTFLAHSF